MKRSVYYIIGISSREKKREVSYEEAMNLASECNFIYIEILDNISVRDVFSIIGRDLNRRQDKDHSLLLFRIEPLHQLIYYLFLNIACSYLLETSYGDLNFILFYALELLLASSIIVIYCIIVESLVKKAYKFSLVRSHYKSQDELSWLIGPLTMFGLFLLLPSTLMSNDVSLMSVLKIGCKCLFPQSIISGVLNGFVLSRQLIAFERFLHREYRWLSKIYLTIELY
ncbi:hypothetical protein FGO68_gene3403 [Halteria grandinella]|uniref:Uncharacterized protein n=1 Tax=Halteria grandinella TaxID=5974 RepID=A0A8J8NNL3_HALGN|nr:hypothetical protein FGO68_gene3403 [Halteria grandinella]